MNKKKRQYWIPVFLVVVILGFLIALLLFRIYFQPKAVLTNAISRAFSQLDARFQKDPLLKLADAYDPDGKYTIEVSTKPDSGEEKSYDANIQVDTQNRRISGACSILSTPQPMNISVYLDPDFMAISTGEAAPSEYYGITYNTFDSDIQKVPLLNMLVSESLITHWGSSIRSVHDAFVQMGNTSLQIPQITRKDLKGLLLGAAALPCRTQRADITVQKKPLTCKKLIYEIGEEGANGILAQLTGKRPSTNSALMLSMFLYQDTLVRAVLTGTDGSVPFQYCLDLGTDPAQNPLLLQGSYGDLRSFSVMITTQSGENQYIESWDIQTTAQGKEADHSFAFDWTPQTETMRLRTKNLSAPLPIILRKEGTQLHLETENLTALLKAIGIDSEYFSMGDSMLAAINISHGSEINVPPYKNLDAWSMEDFLTLLGEIGPMIGIKLE